MTTATAPREALLARLGAGERHDLLVIGGGATGLGVALDAAARGHRVALVEARDFAEGTSSRSTKLVHGGVRYLAQGKLSLVREALHERATLLANAPHLAQPLPFVMPGYKRWERAWFGLGLKVYDGLAGRRSLGGTELLSSAEVRDALPGVETRGLHGGVRYWDAQFDDARLAVALARTALAQGALLLNHCAVTSLVHDAHDEVVGARVVDRETGRAFAIAAKCVVNATGVWVDAVRDMESAPPGVAAPARMVAPSQGVHLVVDRRFLGGDHALLVPRTADGRVLFAVPWLGMTVLGTTDTPRDDLAEEPAPFAEEVDFILGEAQKRLRTAPSRRDVRSIWVGLRPLVRPEADAAGASTTKAMSREHSIRVGRGGLVTVTGGKWTTYRAMAEDVLAQCADAGRIERRPAGATEGLALAGAPSAGSVPLSSAPGEHLYGTDAARLHELPGADRWLWRADGAAGAARGLSEAMVRFAVRHEMARRTEDVLARRSRLLFLDAAEAERIAPLVEALVAEELGRPVDAAALAAFGALAGRYRTLP